MPVLQFLPRIHKALIPFNSLKKCLTRDSVNHQFLASLIVLLVATKGKNLIFIFTTEGLYISLKLLQSMCQINFLFPDFRIYKTQWGRILVASTLSYIRPGVLGAVLQIASILIKRVNKEWFFFIKSPKRSQQSLPYAHPSPFLPTIIPFQPLFCFISFPLSSHSHSSHTSCKLNLFILRHYFVTKFSWVKTIIFVLMHICFLLCLCLC